MDDTNFQAQSTQQPRDAQVRIATGAESLSESDRSDLEVDLLSVWQACYTARSDLNANLAAWSALYELAVEPQEWPWENAANLVIPVVPAELDSMLAYVAAQVFVQRLVIVTAGDNDPETQRLAPHVEKYFNDELRRIRADGKTPIEHLLTVLHLGLRDGGGPCDVLFTERKVPKLVVTNEPKVVDDNVVLGDGGMPETERVVTRVEETVAEVTITPRLLKEWYIAPDESTSIQSALGQCTVLWMTEKELWAKVSAADENKKHGGEGEWYEDAVELVLNRLNAGQSDVSSDVLGSYDKDAGGQINIGQGQGATTSKFFRNRGPAQIIRLYSDQFDMNMDGIAERNVFFFHPDFPKLLGWAPYEYVDEKWPTFCFAPFPRPDRVYGYSLVERLADLVAEMNAGRNQRRNYIDLEIMPILLQREGDSVRDKDRAYYPGAPWIVEDVERSLKWFSPNALPPDSFSDEGRIDVYISKLTGQNAPALGAQSSGRRTATESRQQQTSQTVRANLVAMEYRSFLRAVLQFWYKLLKQYLGASKKPLQTQDPHGKLVELDPSILSRNFIIDVAGLSDPVDASQRRSEMMGALGMLQKTFPWIFADPVKAYAWAAQFVETFQWAGTELLIGTPEEAQQRKQQMEAAAQQQAQMQQQAALTGQQPPTNGKPQQPALPGGQ